MKLNNKIMLITYADSLGSNLKDLHLVLNKYYSKALGGVHILPFFPSGADRGFSPKRYDMVDPAFGDFEDVKAIGEDYYLMFDFMVNHISAQSEYYQDFLKNKDASPYRDFFIRYSRFWENGAPTDKQVDAIYKRKPRAPYVDARFADGSQDQIWCTFSEDQIDLDVSQPAVKEFIKTTLQDMAAHNASLIRLDAFAYACKKAGESCFFMEPEIWDLLEEIQQDLEGTDVQLLPEIHEHYTIPFKLAEKDYWIYDFALPVMVLHALYSHDGQYLKAWLSKCPKKQFTTLDTHDGIGIVDVKDILPDDQIDKVCQDLYTKGANVKKKYSSEAYNNLDIYQINSTYYSALGNNDKAYLLARAIQFFAPGIPQVYYVGMLAGENDIALMEETKNGRDINRHYYSLEEIEKQQERKVVKDLKALMELRNEHPAFDWRGDMEVDLDKDILTIVRRANGSSIKLTANLTTYDFEIE